MDVYNQKKARHNQHLSIVTPHVKDIVDSIEAKVIGLWSFTKLDDIKKFINCIWEMTDSDKNLNELMYEYSLDDKAKVDSFEYEILKTIIQYKRSKGTDLIRLIEMTIDWNRCDVAKREIFDKNIDWVKYKLKLIEIHKFTFL